MIGLGQADWTHVSSQWNRGLQLEQSHIVDNPVGIVVRMHSGLDDLAHNAGIPGGSVDLEQANGDLIPVPMHTMGGGQHIAIID